MLVRKMGEKILLGLVLLFWPVPGCQAAEYSLTPAVEDTFRSLVGSAAVQQGLQFIAADDANTLKDQRTICEIPAPPFQEKMRGEYYRQRLTELGLQNVTMDAAGNVYGTRPGVGKGPRLLVCAHLDTVFPAGTSTAVREQDGRLYAPGIADDSRGLAALLSVIRAFNASGVKTVGDILFCGNVGEEGLGDLRGVKALFRNMNNVDGFITVDGTSVQRITFAATGSHRYEISYHGPGGHSFGAFGLPSAIHAMGRAIAGISDVVTPQDPKTTFTVGTVSGGTSVNSIAADAKMLLDMRSNSEDELLKLEEKVLDIVRVAATTENDRWGSDKITVDVNLVGDRPAGVQPADSPIVQAAWAATLAVGHEPRLSPPSSTDANVPISLGIPAVVLGGGGTEGENHSPTEWFDPKAAYLGPQKVYLTIIGLVGANGISSPLLPKQ